MTSDNQCKLEKCKKKRRIASEYCSAEHLEQDLKNMGVISKDA